jgi:hypothetical protein
MKCAQCTLQKLGLILNNNSYRRVAIATDSLSTLMGVINHGNQERLSWIRHFIYSSRNIQLLGFLDILGKENADAEAKKQLLETELTMQR